jgi:hypothetical protein
LSDDGVPGFEGLMPRYGVAEPAIGNLFGLIGR